MKRIWILLIIAIGSSLCGFGLYWHAGSDKTVQPGETLRSGNSPARIVSLAPNLTEILFALELDEKIVGVSNNSDYPAAAANKKKVGSFWQPNIETIIAAKPDLVVTLQTRTEQQKSVSDSLRRLGFKVLTLKIEKIEELFTA
ncbi:MAG: helical backbone metal receptor, partial [Planctomycetota bacterium]